MLRGVTGSRVVPTITVDSLIIGDLQFRPARLPIVVDALGGADGVLGTDGMEDKRIFIDFRNDRITIFRSRKERAPVGVPDDPGEDRAGPAHGAGAGWATSSAHGDHRHRRAGRVSPTKRFGWRWRAGSPRKTS